MAASGPPPAGIDLNDDLRWTVIGPVIALVVLSTIAVVLRITSRRILKLQLRWDDYLILAALVSICVSTPHIIIALNLIRMRRFSPTGLESSVSSVHIMW
jgi:ABC-type methionine transport system permease subunit